MESYDAYDHDEISIKYEHNRVWKVVLHLYLQELNTSFAVQIV
jgi:hypothetical protein